MLKKLHQFVRNAYLKKIDATGLAVFRIFFLLVFFMEVLQLYYFRQLVFDTVPFLKPSELDFGPVIIVWLGIILLIIFGLFTRTATFINYLFTVLFFGLCTSFEYHMFYIYTGINFLLMFLPVSKVISIDRLRTKLKYSNTRFSYDPPRTVSQLAYTIPLLIAVAFVYFDSIFYKFTSPMWLSGLGFWLPASMPIVTHVDGSLFLNMKYVSMFLGYLTLVFELVFLFTFWFKKFRIPLLVIGIGLHIGILIQFAIPWFGLGVTAIYMLLVPVSWWRKLKRRPVKLQRLTFYYDAECPLCARTKTVIEHFDTRQRIKFLSAQSHYKEEPSFQNKSLVELLLTIYSVDNKGNIYSGYDTYIRVAQTIPWMRLLSLLLRLPGIFHIGKKIYQYIAHNRNAERCTEDNCGYVPPPLPPEDDKIKILHSTTLADIKIAGITAGLITLILFQLIISLNSTGPAKAIRWVLGKEHKDNAVRRFSLSVRNFTKPFLGITNHGVFMDNHFMNYNHLFAITFINTDGSEVWTPVIRETGQPGLYAYGSQMVNWDFRVVHAAVNQQSVVEGIKNYTAFWAGKNEVSLMNATFKIKIKEIETPREWRKDFLKEQLIKPWRDIGNAQWQDNEFSCSIENIQGL